MNVRLRDAWFCAAAVPLLVSASEPLRLQPSSPWVVDYAENNCRLIRTFGDDKAQVKLAFESDAPDEASMMAFGRPLETVSQAVTARFLPVGSRSFPGRVAQTSSGAVPAIVWREVAMLPEPDLTALKQRHDEIGAHPGLRPPPRDLAKELALKADHEAFAAAATELSLQTGAHRTVVLETGSLGEPFKAFEKCSRDSLKDWGVDAGIEDKIVRPVWASSRTGWIRSEDYPRGMVMRGMEAMLHVRLLVDESGRPTKCTAMSHFDISFDKISCDRIMERARFEPAELADGTKVPSYYVTGIAFRLAP